MLPSRAENEDNVEVCPECMTTVLYTQNESVDDVNKSFADGRRLEGDAPTKGGRTLDTQNRSVRTEAPEVKRSNSDLNILAHAWPLPTRTLGGGGSGVEVLIAGSGRSLPEAKHSSWLRDRRRLDELNAQVGFCASKCLSYVALRLGLSPCPLVSYQGLNNVNVKRQPTRRTP